MSGASDKWEGFSSSELVASGIMELSPKTPREQEPHVVTLNV